MQSISQSFPADCAWGIDAKQHNFLPTVLWLLVEDTDLNSKFLCIAVTYSTVRKHDSCSLHCPIDGRTISRL